jgi:hypothetical protein
LFPFEAKGFPILTDFVYSFQSSSHNTEQNGESDESCGGIFHGHFASAGTSNLKKSAERRFTCAAGCGLNNVFPFRPQTAEVNQFLHRLKSAYIIPPLLMPPIQNNENE